MADKRLRSIKWPELPDRYFVKDYDADIAQIFEDVYNLYPRKSLPSASIHSFADGADNIPIKAMSVDVRAVQNLHGYDAPFPTGSSKNILPLTINNCKSLNTAGTWSGNAYTYLGVTYTIKTDDGGNILAITSSGTATGAANFVLCNPVPCVANTEYKVNGITGGSTSTYNFRLGKADNSYWMNVSDGDTAITPTENSFTIRIGVSSGANMNGKTFYPMVRLATVADATFAPYGNVCAISGWTQAQIVDTGVNVWDEEWENGYYSTTTGVPIASTTEIRSKNAVPVLPNTEYCFRNSGSGYGRVIFYKDNGTGSYISSVSFANNVQTFTTPSNCRYLRFYMNTAYGATYNHDISINYPSTDTSYHAYSGHLVTIEFNGTVYGGTLRYVGGLEWEFTATHAIVDMGSTTWSYSSLNAFFYISGAYIKNASELMCSAYNFIGSKNDAQMADAPDYSIASGPNSGYIKVKDTRYTDHSAFETAVTGQKLVYELATPLDPITLYADAEVVTQYGDNVMFADCGDSTLTYRQDIGLILGE